jgi:multimeric flavodoxin WrbA
MKKVLIVYHTQSGNTEVMAKAVAEGAKAAGATVTLKKAVDANAQDIMECDILAIGTPNYFGYMSGMVKDFFDRAWATIREKVGDKPYVTFGSKGGGGAQALETVARICDGLKMIKASEDVIATRTPTPEVITECKELGKKIAKLEKVERSKKIEEPKL